MEMMTKHIQCCLSYLLKDLYSHVLSDDWRGYLTGSPLHSLNIYLVIQYCRKFENRVVDFIPKTVSPDGLEVHCSLMPEEGEGF